MALILKNMFLGYSWLFAEVADPRVNDFLFMSSPMYPAAICIAYLYFVYDIGPKLMKDRPPFELKKIIMLFNLIQVLINGYIVFHGTFNLHKFSWYCSPVDYSVTPFNKFILRMSHLYFLTKLMDLLDTVFMVLRKKEGQISFLHVYHHSGMAFISWVGIKFLAGGHSLYMGYVNSIVHTVMYFYYLVTTIWPEYKNNLWWKKHITQLQMAQFFFFIITYGQLLFKPNCAFPKIASYFLVPQNLFMLMLFGDFYYKAYVRPKKVDITSAKSKQH